MDNAAKPQKRAPLFSDYPDCLSVNQLQDMLSVGKNAAYMLLKTGQIQHRRMGKKYLIPKTAVVEYLYGSRNA